MEGSSAGHARLAKRDSRRNLKPGVFFMRQAAAFATLMWKRNIHPSLRKKMFLREGRSLPQLHGEMSRSLHDRANKHLNDAKSVHQALA